MNISALLSSPGMGAASFTVERSAVRRRKGAAEKTSGVLIPTVGCVQPGRADQTAMLPEEDRREEFIVIYTAFPLCMGENLGRVYHPPDRIHWDGRVWRLVALEPWTVFRFCRGTAVLVPEEKPEENADEEALP